MILVIDNYDSFVYNLSRYVEREGFGCMVARNNRISIEDIKNLNVEKIILSPGPKTPLEAGITLDLLHYLKYKPVPVLGICLGHQAICASFGAKIVKAVTPVHGKSSIIKHTSEGIFKGFLSNKMKVARYHSLIASDNGFPKELQITARCEKDKQIMAVQHNELPFYGLQFHPESILTNDGRTLIKNFLVNTSS